VANAYGSKIDYRDFYVYVWAALVGGTVLLFVVRNIVFTFWTLAAAKNLHNGIFVVRMNCPLLLASFNSFRCFP